jgi:hypothetical protein
MQKVLRQQEGLIQDADEDELCEAG